MSETTNKRSIGSLTSWLSGGTPSRSRAEYWSGDIPWISAFTLKEAEIGDSDQHLTAEAVAAGSKMAPLNATLLLVRGSALHSEIRAGLVVAPVAFNQDVKALVPKPGLNPKYLTHAIRSNESALLKLVTSAGNTAGVLDTKVVQSFEIYFPDSERQSEIVSVLDDVDDLVASLEQLIAKNQAIKQGMMQQLLMGRTRLPGFSGEWKDGQLSDVLSVKHGRSQHEVETANGKYPILGTGGVIGRTDTPLYSRPSVLIGRKGTIDRPQYRDTPFWTVDTLFYTEINPTADPRFLYFVFTTVDWRSMNEASGVPSLNASRIAAVEIQIPPIEEQRAIASVLRDCELEIEALQHQLTSTRKIKQGMMQELLTGRTRLQPTEVAE